MTDQTQDEAQTVLSLLPRLSAEDRKKVQAALSLLSSATRSTGAEDETLSTKTKTEKEKDAHEADLSLFHSLLLSTLRKEGIMGPPSLKGMEYASPRLAEEYRKKFRSYVHPSYHDLFHSMKTRGSSRDARRKAMFVVVKCLVRAVRESNAPLSVRTVIGRMDSVGGLVDHYLPSGISRLMIQRD